MELKKESKESRAIRITIEENGNTVGRIYLYLIYNDLHAEPYGLLEDLFVEEEYRGKGIGKQLVQTAIEEAKAQGCHKLRFTSRRSRTELHEWYDKLGFDNYGFAFKMDLK